MNEKLIQIFFGCTLSSLALGCAGEELTSLPSEDAILEEGYNGYLTACPAAVLPGTDQANNYVLIQTCDGEATDLGCAGEWVAPAPDDVKLDSAEATSRVVASITEGFEDTPMWIEMTALSAEARTQAFLKPNLYRVTVWEVAGQDDNSGKTIFQTPFDCDGDSISCADMNGLKGARAEDELGYQHPAYEIVEQASRTIHHLVREQASGEDGKPVYDDWADLDLCD